MRPIVALLALLLVVAGLSACAADKAAPANAMAGNGWIVELTTREGKANMFARFELDRNGTLSYTAGRDSRLVWTGPLTDDEQREIAALVEANPEPTRIDPPGYDEPGRRYHLMTCRPGALISKSVESGPTPYLDELYGLFQKSQMAHRKGLTDPLAIPPVK